MDLGSVTLAFDLERYLGIWVGLT